MIRWFHCVAVAGGVWGGFGAVQSPGPVAAAPSPAPGLIGTGRVVLSQAPQYRLAVTNSMPHPMDVFFRDTADHALGTLGAGERKVFAIVATRPRVEVTWRAGVMGHAGGWMVTLRPDSIVEVTF